MEEFKAIEFQRTRDFSNKMNATFEFIRQNFKSLGKSILYIAGPAVLVGSLLIGSFMGEFLTLSQSMQNYSGNPEAFNDYFLSANFWLQLILMFVFLFISFIVTIATINNYLIIYDERKTNKIDVQEVWDRVRNTFWTYLGSALLFFLLLLIAYVILLIPIFVLSAISGFLIFFGVVFFIGGLFLLSTHMIVRSLIESLGRRGIGLRKTAIVGANRLGLEVARNAKQSSDSGMMVMGFFDDRGDGRRSGIEDDLPPFLGDSNKLLEMIAAGQIDTVLITLPMRAEGRIQSVLDRLANTTASA